MASNAGVCTLFALILKAWRRALFFFSMLKYLTNSVLEVLRVRVMVALVGICSNKQNKYHSVKWRKGRRGEPLSPCEGKPRSRGSRSEHHG
jgi:hypothetical protein